MDYDLTMVDKVFFTVVMILSLLLSDLFILGTCYRCPGNTKRKKQFVCRMWTCKNFHDCEFSERRTK